LIQRTPGTSTPATVIYHIRLNALYEIEIRARLTNGSDILLIATIKAAYAEMMGLANSAQIRNCRLLLLRDRTFHVYVD
jgi:hypothetical protein